VNELTSIEKVVLLESVVLFSYCTADELVRIEAIAEERRFGSGEVVYRADEPADALYCVVSGEISIDESDGKGHLAGPTAPFGVAEILGGRLRHGTATATRESLLLAIDAEDFFDLLSNNIEIVRSLFRIVLEGRAAAAGI
jgi:CRP/FNR family transcriptional regulator